MNKPAIVGFVLITLLVGSIVSPAVSKQITVNKGTILESNPKPGDSKWFATLRMDFGEEIFNDKICWLGWKFRYPRGNYHVNVDINFRCPSNRKLNVTYYVYAFLMDTYSGELDTLFCELEDSIIIINGSNPPDINKNYVEYVYQGNYLMTLQIQATLTVYKYVDGEWVKIGEDDTDKIVERALHFRMSKSSSITFENLIERIPNMFPILRHLLRL